MRILFISIVLILKTSLVMKEETEELLITLELYFSFQLLY